MALLSADSEMLTSPGQLVAAASHWEMAVVSLVTTNLGQWDLKPVSLTQGLDLEPLPTGASERGRQDEWEPALWGVAMRNRKRGVRTCGRT